MQARNGFTVVELMSALAIVAVLTSLMLPLYHTFVARSRQGEAKTNLKIIKSLQAAYYLDHYKTFGSPATTKTLNVGNVSGGCSDANKENDLGFNPKNCDALRYSYTTNGNSSREFKATAKNEGTPQNKQIYPNCTEEDKWIIRRKIAPRHKSNAIKECK